MSTEMTYDYTIIRVVPRVERGERINVGVILSCVDAAEFFELALMKYGDPIANILDIGQHVAAHQHGLAASLQVDDQIFHLTAADRIEARRWFVEDD